MPAVQLPYVKQPAARMGRRLWRKQVLPLAKVEHPDYGDLDFTRENLRELVETFDGGAMDQVPFSLVTDDNAHSDDPERYRGEVRSLELADDGLYALIDASERGAQLLSENPRLPVSVRITTPKIGPFAGRQVLGHVAGTPDPVARGMRPWEVIDASDDGEVRDFSVQGCYTSLSMADTQTPPQGNGETPEALSTEEVGLFRGLLQRLGGNGGSTSTTDPETGADPLNQPPGNAPAEPDPALAELLDSLDSDPADEREPVTLSNPDPATIELTQRVERAEVRAGTAELANRLSGYLDEGVPPTLINAAKAQLLGDSDEHKAIAIDFANGREPAAAKALFAVLDGAKGTIDFTEVGSGNTPTEDEDYDAEIEEWHKRSIFGGGA